VTSQKFPSPKGVQRELRVRYVLGQLSSSRSVEWRHASAPGQGCQEVQNITYFSGTTFRGRDELPETDWLVRSARLDGEKPGGRDLPVCSTLRMRSGLDWVRGKLVPELGTRQRQTRHVSASHRACSGFLALMVVWGWALSFVPIEAAREMFNGSVSWYVK